MTYLNKTEYEVINTLKPVVGLGFPIQKSSGGLFHKKKNLAVIASQLRQLLGTEQGERVMRPDFGLKLRKFVFQPLDSETLADIREVVINAIRRYANEVILKNIVVFEDTRVGREDLNATVIRLQIAWAYNPYETQEIEVNIA
jgi:phage baseplate assembly protein W